MSLLRVEGLTKRFAGLTAVRDIHIDLENKEFLGIVGPNGAGKTTLFSLISGQIPATDGRIVFDGVDITGWPADRSRLRRPGAHLPTDAAVREHDRAGERRHRLPPEVPLSE